MRFGFFSAEAELEIGSVVYSTPDGGEVIVTTVCKNADEKPGYWLDSVAVGEVCESLRRHALGKICPPRRSCIIDWSDYGNEEL